MYSFKISQTYVEFLRPYNASIPLTSLLIGYFYPTIQKVTIDIPLACLIIILAHSFATVQNDIEDIAIDTINSPENTLVRKALSLTEAKRLLTILGIAVVIICLLKPFPHFIFGILALGASWLYNKPPFLFSRKPFLSLIILVATSTILPMLYGWWLSGKKINALFLISLACWSLLRISISLLKDFKDEKGDRAEGKKTFYLQYGRNLTIFSSLTLFIIASIGICVISLFIRHINWFFVIPIIVAIYNIMIRVKLLTIKNAFEGNKIFNKSFLAENRFSVGYLLWLILSF